MLNLLLLKRLNLLIVVGYDVLLKLLLKMLIVVGTSFVECAVVEVVDCCRLLVLFVEIVESVVEDVDHCRLHYVL